MGPTISPKAKVKAPEVTSTRLEAEVMGVTAIKEVMEIAGRKPFPFRDALDVGEILIPPLFSKEDSELQREYQSPEERFYRDQADAESTLAKKEITPAALVQKEIARLKKLVGVASDGNAMERKLRKLEGLLGVFRKRPVEEGVVISRDALQVGRQSYALHATSITRVDF